MATGGAAIDTTAAGTTTASSKLNLQALQSFHQRCGRRITLTNGNRTATRSVRDFSHALVFSAEPLIDDILFEVVIEKKNHSWGGSIEIGVTSEPPEKLELPSCATVMRNGTWVMSGIDVRKDGMCLTEFYGTDLEMLNEMDRVGVMRTSNNELVFYVNGESQGVAARNMPKILWALVDLYGRCVQVSLCPTDTVHGSRDYSDIGEVPLSVDITVSTASGGGGGCVNALSQAISLTETSTSLTNVGVMSSLPGSIMGAPPVLTNITTSSISSSSTGDYFDMNDRLRFHTRCGSLVKLSPNCRSAERRRPLDEFNNGVVMTHRPLRDNELFEIRIDKLVDKWSGSIEVGVTTHNPSVLHFPATMTNMRSGTIMMSGCGILTNGKGTRRQYGEFNLDELREGDRVGMMRKSNSNLHYYINGQDQGVAANRVATTLWGVIDLYGMTIKVTIVDRDEREQQNLVTRRNNLISAAALASLGGIHGVSNAGGVGGGNSTAPTPALNFLSPESEVIAIPVTSLNSATATTNGRNEDRLTFHPMCGSHATVTHSGRTALRPNASDDFNNGVVLTRRPLRPNELFQVRLERVVTKWAGSVEIGVTTYSAEELDFPFTMTNVRAGTWMMTGNGVMHNGITVIEQYGENLDRLQVGDRVGVVRKDTGTLHFWVNGVDQGPAATNVPEKVYGVIDLYGQAAQASIVDTSEVGSPDTGNSTISNTTLYSETPLRFHTIHGKNASISNGGLTASRPNSLAEFNDAIVFSNRPLRQRELFEVVLENMVCHWSGNIEIGVTGTRPEDIQLASNATETDAADTIILCGPMIFNNRTKVRSNILIDLDTLGKGARVGVMRNGDYVHFYIDGVDQGPACECRSPSIWAVVDLYGQCAQVSLTQNSNADVRAPYATSENSQSCQGTSVIQPVSLETKHRWTCISGNVTLLQNWTVASRLSGSSAALSRCVVFSEHPLSVGSPFEIKLVTYNPLFAGCLNVGITDLNLTDNNVRKNIPLSIKRIPANVWYVSGNEVRYNSQLLQRSMASLEWLRVGDRITLELTSARTLKILLNSEDMNIQFHNIPNDVYVVVELQGSTMAVQVISSQGPTSPLRPCSLRLQDSLEFGVDPLNKQDSMLESIDSEGLHYEFSEFYGKNIHLFEERRSAMRVQSYNQGLVYVTKALCKGESINIKVDAVNSKWKGTIGLGVVGACPQSSNALPIPPSIVQCKRPCWVATHDYININGQNISSKYGEALMNIRPGTIITMTLTHAGMLVIMMDSINLDLDFANGLPNHVYPVFDIYGKCERISIVSSSDAGRNGTPIIEEPPGFERDLLNDHESNVPQCEKAYLEVHEKETESQTVAPEGCGTSNSSSMNRSVLESVSENLLLNLSIKNRTLEQQGCSAEPSSTSSSCWLRESLQLQHNTNLNIQRSQGSQRFRNALLAYALSPCADNATVATDEPTKSDAEAKQLIREFFGNNTDYDDDYFAPNEPAPLRVFNIDTDSSGVGGDDGDTSSNDNNLIMENSEEESGAVGGVSLLHELANDCRDLPANLQADANLALKQQQHENNSNSSIVSDTNNDKDRTVSVENILSGEEVAAAPVDNTLETNVIRPKRPDAERVRFVDVATSELSTSSSNSSTNQFDSLQSIAPLKYKDCDYLKLVQQFRLSLLLPDTFFQSECEPVCFCPHCNAQASEDMQGWVYFKLNQQTVNFNMSSRQLAMDNENCAGSSSSGDEWLPLFYMTRVDKIRAILDRGQPLPMDSGGNDSRTQVSSHQKDEPSSRLELYKSPNSASVLANGQYMYLNNGYVYSINAAFEVYVKRQALCADGQNNKVTKLAHTVTERRSSNNEGDGCASSSSSSCTSFFAAAPFATHSRELFSSDTSGATSATSTHSNSSTHIQTWFTKEAGACIITALILRLKKQYSSHNKPA